MRRLRACAAGTVVLVLTGCTLGNSQSPTATQTTPSATSSQPLPSQSADDKPAPPAPSPDPSTAGSLDASSLPQEFLGFTPDVRAPEEDEFVPNGTWVYAAKDPAAAADQTWPRCGMDVPVPPEHVLMGLYANDAGAVGIGQAFEFLDGSAADNWFRDYARDISQCAALGESAFTHVVEHSAADGVLVDRRLMAGEPWGERVWVDGDTVVFVAVQNGAALGELLGAL